MGPVRIELTTLGLEVHSKVLAKKGAGGYWTYRPTTGCDDPTLLTATGMHVYGRPDLPCEG